MAKPVAPALERLLVELIDYAGTFPPSTLPCAAAVDKYLQYRRGERAWMLGKLVVSAADVEKAPEEHEIALSVLSEVDLPRAVALESKRVVPAVKNKRVYCEVPIQELDAVKRAGSCAKIRTGGVKPEAIPSVESVAEFILACADRKLAFKATAGLHHPVRAEQALTYEPNAPRAVMHGFLNVFLAAAFAWYGRRDIVPVLAETDPRAFRFDERAWWRDWSVDAGQIYEVRTGFAHSFGSCSFEEPVQDLEALGLL